MRKLVKLNKRPSRDGKSFTYVLRYVDDNGKRRWKTLGHSDGKKAERQRAQLEKELRMGYVEPGQIRLSELMESSLRQTRGQVRESTLKEARIAMEQLMAVIGNIDCSKVGHRHGEIFMQACLDKGDSQATANKKLRHLKRLLILRNLIGC